jgi:hypothetical protein
LPQQLVIFRTFAALSKEQTNQQLDAVINQLSEMVGNKDLHELRENTPTISIKVYCVSIHPP